jgi:hypothetical protein
MSYVCHGEGGLAEKEPCTFALFIAKGDGGRGDASGFAGT